MDMLTISKPTAQSVAKTVKVRANDLLSTFNEYASKIKVLSLDCFDTILWRNVAEPTDVFYDLANRPLFKQAGISKLMRVEAESFCMVRNQMRYGTSQVTLKEIYQQIFPHANDSHIQTFMEEELAAEVEACYAFAPIVEVIRAAYAKKIKIIIVSDTYLEKAYLSRLLTSKLPADAMAAISEIICSCDHKQSKANGLFIPVLQKMHVSANAILHIGDNPISDFAAATTQGMNALHLLHHEDAMEEVLRMQTISASLFDTAIRVSRAAPSPFRGLLATGISHATAESLIGYAATGPVLYAFAHFIHHEVEKLKNQGKNPKILFLMRDAYLPSLVCETMEGKTIGTQVRISRFVSYAASFRTPHDIESYLKNNINSERFEDLCRQLLIPENISTPVIKKISGKTDAIQQFCAFVFQADTMHMIFQASIDFSKRLIRYLEKEIDLKPEDCLLLVDLGYTGTTQIKLAPILKDEINIDVIVCYLISLRTH